LSSERAPVTPPTPDTRTSVHLLRQARLGDAAAMERLFAEQLPKLRRWTRGRLPGWARDLADTSDLVQDALLATFRRLDRFDPRIEGALQAYLRQAVLNRIRDEARRAKRRPAPEPLDHELHEAPESSPLEGAIGIEAATRYRAALDGLHPEEREAVVARVELGYSFAQIAHMLGKPSPDAARVAVNRALARLALAMDRA
jgi:RNA polymerase sigma-70 factor, ECF subfamily